MSDPTVRLARVDFDADETPKVVTLVVSPEVRDWLRDAGYYFLDERIPDGVRLRMGIRTACTVAKRCGKSTGVEDDHPITYALYDALTGAVFNRFWDGGTDEAWGDLGLGVEWDWQTKEREVLT